MKTLVLALLCALSWPLQCSSAWAESRYFTTTDGVRLHYIDEGAGETLLFVPGWVMPAEIWRRQIDHFARNYRVIAVDPRSQGRSEIAQWGNDIRRHAEDLNELIGLTERTRARELEVDARVERAWALVQTARIVDAEREGLALVGAGEHEGITPHEGRRCDHRISGPRDREQRWASSSRRCSGRPPEYLAWPGRCAAHAAGGGRPPAIHTVPETFWRSAVYQTKRALLYL